MAGKTWCTECGMEQPLHSSRCLTGMGILERAKDRCAPEGEAWPAVKEETKEYVAPAGPAEGRKNDSGKLRYDLVPPGPLAKLVDVYTIGAKKYDDRNWEKGIRWGRVFAAMMRHAWAYWRGERDDPADGQHHLASVAWCAFALMEYEDTHPELDDRRKK